MANLIPTNQNPQPQRLSADAEVMDVFMQGAREIVPVIIAEVNQARVKEAEIQAAAKKEELETQREVAKATERVLSARDKNVHREILVLYGVITLVVAVGGTASVVAFFKDKPEIGHNIITAVLSMIVGLLGGKAITDSSRRREKASEDQD